jgi:hypothetical protein|tara:strand:+ start:263 stop:505 length:243 start_codon:yes stop_codon:yes gene_type:complete
MEHPLVNSVDSLTIDELGSKISELNKKIGISIRMGNSELIHQLEMAREVFQNKYAEKSAALFNKTQDGKGPNFDQIIDIS